MKKGAHGRPGGLSKCVVEAGCYFFAAIMSFSHFFIELVLAAPASGLPFLSTALASQAAPPAALSHFFMKLV